MPVEIRSLGYGDHVVYREAKGGTLPAWLFRELLSIRVAAGDSRSAILIIPEGEPLAILSKRDLDALLSLEREHRHDDD